MFPLLAAVPPAETSTGLLLAVTIALSATALVAIGFSLAALRRRMKLSRVAVSIGGAIALLVLVGSLLVGGSLTRPPTAVADGAPRGQATAPFEAKLTGFQLPTL